MQICPNGVSDIYGGPIRYFHRSSHEDSRPALIKHYHNIKIMFLAVKTALYLGLSPTDSVVQIRAIGKKSKENIAHIKMFQYLEYGKLIKTQKGVRLKN